MNKYVLLISIASISIFSCSDRLYEGQKIYKINDTGVDDVIEEYEVTDGVKVKAIETKDKGVVFEELDGISIPVTGPINTKTLLGGVTDSFRKNVGDNYYLPDKDLSTSGKGYMSYDFALQAVNISFKNRFSVDSRLSEAVRDSFPSTWSSSFSPAIALGYSVSRNQFNRKGSKTEISITFGIFGGFGTVDINDKVTRNPKYTLSRKALTTNRGFFANIGIQKWDFGYAFGWETAYGPGSDLWIYQKEPFHGIIIGYDLVKLRD